MKLCTGSTKAGKPCRAPAGPSGLCYFHANPENARTLGKIGGLRNRKFTGVDLQVPDDISLADLRKLEVKVLRGLLSGEIPAREVAASTQILNLLHRDLQMAEIEKRIKRLEEGS